MPKIALRGREGLKLKAIRLQGKKLGLDIGLLRLSDSGANSAVGAFTTPGQSRGAEADQEMIPVAASLCEARTDTPLLCSCCAERTPAGRRLQGELLQLPQRHDQQVHRENPNKDHLPEPQITGAVVIARHFRVAVEEAFPNAQNVKPREEHDHQADAEDDSQRENGIGVLVDDGKNRVAILLFRMGGAVWPRKSLRWRLAPAAADLYKSARRKRLATSPRNDSKAKGRNTMNPEPVHQSDMPENAETRNGAIDETGKVDRIRDILFGSQMRDYDGRFQRLDERLTREAAETRADTQKRLEALENFMKGALESVTNRLNTEHSARGQRVEKLARDLAETAKSAGTRPRRIWANMPTASFTLCASNCSINRRPWATRSGRNTAR